ncbi:MAG: tRNA (N6-threonylcarbamoyladenosine(37)-N6)-methyltransferase TrmO [Clostridia bacterium]|nr:tRNA (N6-threonylcarbamoyladenosine(37)-N6)-methyltransferase TrmO [Clostridia bacterium]
MKIIARIESGFPSKFGIPRQSGLVKSLPAKIIFEPEFRSPDAIRGLEGFSHLWIIWKFSESGESNSLTVRPPRLGGNTRLGVFATRSPFRPNPIGLSCVKIESIEQTQNRGTVINILGADLMDGTPIYDIKPYLPHSDCITEAVGGFSDEVKDYCLKVEIPEQIKESFDRQFIETVTEILENDPRPSYHRDPERIYGFPYAGYEIKFRVQNDLLTVVEIKND